MPVLGSLYLTMMERCPNATSYTYINGDIIAMESDFINTIEAVLNVRLGKEFLIVGRRTNVAWSLNASFDATYEGFNFTTNLENGNLFYPMAEDYFIMSKNAIDWANIPPFVIGRAAYDNWLVEHANLQPNLDVIDATNTLPVIHQDDERGEFSWGGLNETLTDANVWYNKRLQNWWKDGLYQVSLNKGKTYHAAWETNYYNFEGGHHIVVHCRRNRKRCDGTRGHGLVDVNGAFFMVPSTWNRTKNG